MSEPKRNIPLLRLAWRNTRRNTRRTLLTVAAVAVAVAASIFALAYVNGILDNMLDTYARTESGHVRLRAEGYSKRERSLPLHHNLPHLSETLAALRAQPGVKEALPRIRTMVLVDGVDANRPGLLLGVDLAREEGYLNPAAMVTAGRLPRAGYAELMVGRDFARKLEVGVGDTLTLLGQTSYRSLGGLRATVTGLATTGLGHLDATLLLTSLDQVQAMTDLPDATTEILVFADDFERADTLAAALARAVQPVLGSTVEVLSWKDQGPLIRMIETTKPLMGVVLFILLLMASLVIVNTMLMTVMERTQELGMLAALGMRRNNIVSLIVAEGAVIGLIGAVIGGVLATGVSIWLEHTGIDMTAAARSTTMPFQGIVYPDWKLIYTLAGLFLGTLTAALAALYPAWRASRQKPAEALRP